MQRETSQIVVPGGSLSRCISGPFLVSPYIPGNFPAGMLVWGMCPCHEIDFYAIHDDMLPDDSRKDDIKQWSGHMTLLQQRKELGNLHNKLPCKADLVCMNYCLRMPLHDLSPIATALKTDLLWLILFLFLAIKQVIECSGHSIFFVNQGCWPSSLTMLQVLSTQNAGYFFSGPEFWNLRVEISEDFCF